MLVKEQWEEFLGSKKRTAQTHYSQGRMCSVCDRFITDNNKSGHCEECGPRSAFPKKLRGDSGYESQGHAELKHKALYWLKRQGATKVGLEKYLVVGKKRFIADVYGLLKGRIIIIECGGSQDRKLDRLKSNKVFDIYIWPYGHEKPYRLYPHLKVCNRCGNCMSSLTDLETA